MFVFWHGFLYIKVDPSAEIYANDVTWSVKPLDGFCLKFLNHELVLAFFSQIIILWCFLRSGKSTYLQQVCLIVILAQIGCYIPARYATLRVIDRIFTRMGTIDCLESNSSTVGATIIKYHVQFLCTFSFLYSLKI